MIVKTSRGGIYQTCLEKRTQEELDRLGIRYVQQYPTRLGFVLDFAIFLDDGQDKQKIDLEVDGTAWHTNKKAIKHDNFRNYLLKRDGWKIFRIRENFFKEDFDKFKMEFSG